MNRNRRQLREITTSGATGGFQSSVVGFVSPLRRPKKMTPTQVDRFHADLKRALGQSESSMFRQNQKVSVHFGSGSGPFSTSKGVVKSAYKIQGDKFVDVVMDGDSKDDHTTFMWNGKTWVVYMDNQEEDAVKIQAESHSPVVKRIDAVLETLHEGRHEYTSVTKYDGYWIAVSHNSQRSDGKPYFVSVYEVDPREYHPKYGANSRFSVYREGLRTEKQAIAWAQGEIKRGNVLFYRHDDYGNPVDADGEPIGEAYTGCEELDDDGTELRIFIDNDSDLYRRQTQPIFKNLMLKIGQGKYNRDLAVKLFMYLVDAGAQKYAKEYGTADQPWNKLFPKKLRELVAASLRNHFETEAALGNYNNYLPAKYSTTDVAAVLSAAGFTPR